MKFTSIKILFTFPCLFIFIVLYILTPEQNISIQISNISSFLGFYVHYHLIVDNNSVFFENFQFYT